MTDRYAVIGHPIGHSKSPQIHRLFARATGQDMVYEAIDGGAEPQGFARALAAFGAAGGRGLNVTLPFKLQACASADAVSESARLAGAANALRFDGGGRVEAENFDGAGLVRDLQTNLRVPLAGSRVLLLGAGGAARGAALPLLRAGVADLLIVNRTAGKALELAQLFAPLAGAARVRGGGLDALEPAPAQPLPFDVVINATSASLGAHALAIPPAALAGARLAYDMVYGQGLTPFLRAAQAAGAAQLADGVGMLVEQAAESFAWWRGVRPETADVIALMRLPLV
ncbi:MAG: shikimate dehydrogenase [Burkholderiaceae bacterium]|jgi:shikimate dehydrogenase|nr:shikimate dehydrogenase [Burkholderiaceae bacterium]